MNEEHNARDFTRVDAPIQAILAAGAQRISGTIQDISMNGARIGCDTPLPLGTLCPVTIMLDGGRETIRLEIEAEVVRSEPGSMALSFCHVEADSLRHLQHLVQYNAADNADAVEKELEASIGVRRVPDQ